MAASPVFKALSNQRWRMHASAVCLGDAAIVIVGPPSSGKSTHAAYFIEQGGMLIGDDYIDLTREGDHLYASAVPEIAGVLALDGFGLLSVAHAPDRVRLTHEIQLAAHGHDPLLFTGIALPPYPQPVVDVARGAHLLAVKLVAQGAALPPDWIPKRAINP